MMWASHTDKLDSLIMELDRVEVQREIPILIQISRELARDSFFLAYEYSEEALLLSENVRSSSYVADILTWQGDLWRIYCPNKEERRFAISPYKQALELFTAINDTLRMGVCNRKIGETYKLFSNYENALPYLYKAIGLFSMVRDSVNIVDAYLDIGEIFYQREDWDYSIFTNEKALDYCLKKCTNRQKIRLYTNMGKACKAKGDYELAKQYYDNVFALELESYKFLPTKSLNLKGFIYLKIDEIDSAKSSFDAAYSRVILHKDTSDLSHVYAGWAEYYKEKKNNEVAIHYLKRSSDIALKYGMANRLMENYGAFADIYHREGKLAEEIFAKDQYYALRDSLKNAQQQMIIRQLKVMYDFDIQKQHLEKLEALNQNHILQIQSERHQRISAWVIAILLLVILAFLSIQYLQNQRTNQELERQVGERTQQLRGVNHELKLLNEELDVLSYRTAHDIRGPVARLLGLCQVAKNEQEYQKDDLYLNLIHREARNMDVMLHRFLEVNKIKHLNIQQTVFNLHNLLIEVIEGSKDVPGFDDIFFANEIDPSQLLEADREVLRIILKNLIENGIIYADRDLESSSQIEIIAFEEDEDVIILVRDNGIGIPEELSERIFEMFFRASPVSKGLGLGLYAAQLAAKKLGGTIRLNTNQLYFTEFEVVIPQYAHNNDNHIQLEDRFFPI